MTMKITLTVHCDVCDGVHDTPFEDEEVREGTELGDEHETSGLVRVTDYQGSATAWLCATCHEEHLEEQKDNR